MGIEDARPFSFRVADLPVGTRALAYQAVFDPTASPASPANFETCQLVGPDNPHGRGFAVLKNLRPGWTRIQCGNLWSDEFFWDGDSAKTVEFSVVNGKLVVRTQDNSGGGDGGGVVPPADPDGLKKQFLPGTFTASVSYYGALSAPLDRVKRDLTKFRQCGFGNARIWIDWPSNRAPDSSCMKSDGSVIPEKAKHLDEILSFMASIGMSADLTMRAAAYDFKRVTGEGYDIPGHKAAVRNVLMRWGKHPAVRILDVANEAEVLGGSPGSGSPGNGHVSPGRFAELMTVVRSVPHTCLVGASVSGGGEFKDVVKNHWCMNDGHPAGLMRDTVPEILLPHFSRVSGWGANEGPNAKKLAAVSKFKGIPIHHQEPARRNHPVQGQNLWPVAEFEASFKSAKANGSVGCCFHYGGCFNLSQKDAWDQMDEVEKTVANSVAGWIR